MKRSYIFLLLSILILSSNLQAQYRVHTSDITHFWQAFDSLKSISDPKVQEEILQTLYVDRGTEGLKEFMKVRGGNPERWRMMISLEGEKLEKQRPYTLSAIDQKPIIDEKLENFKKLYPDFIPGDVFFTVGIGNTGGTVEGNHVLIGCEVVASEKENWAVPLVMHEFVHVQQKNRSNNHLLSHCIMEGMADFISELTLEEPITKWHPDGHIGHGLKHDKEVWEAFKKDMGATSSHKGWLYGGGGQVIAGRQMNDMGYYMGYRICRSYYERVGTNDSLKKGAIRYLLNLDLSTDEKARAFLLASGYVPKEDIRYVQKLKFGKKEDKGRRVVFGYKKKKKDIIFEIEVPQGASLEGIKYITVAGTFNKWNPKSEAFKMEYTGDRIYQLRVPKEKILVDKKAAFKFVVNGEIWVHAPENAKNVDFNDNGNLLIN